MSMKSRRFVTIILCIIFVIIGVLFLYNFYKHIRNNNTLKTFFVDSEEAEQIVLRDYTENKAYFNEVAALLLNYSETDLRFSNDSNVTPTDLTKNEYFYKNNATKSVDKLGYDVIAKSYENGIYFFRFRQPFLGRGLMYYKNGFCPDYNENIIKYLPITEDGWYYFEES